MSGINSLNGIKPGDLYTTDGQDLWRVESMCERPTITLRNLDSGERCGGAIGCLNLDPFEKARIAVGDEPDWERRYAELVEDVSRRTDQAKGKA